MKQYLFTACLFLSVNAFAQKNTGTPLKKDQEITITTVNKMNVDMMMPMINNSTTTHKVKVIDVDAKNYKVTSTVTKLLIDGSVMGQSLAYDSDKKEDRDSEQGKELGASLNKTDTFLIDIKTGEGKDMSPEKSLEVNPGDGMQAMMSGAVQNSGSATVSSIFFVIPGEIKTGVTWSDSSSAEGIKTVNTYKIDKIENGIITISTKGLAEGTTSMEAQGQSMDMKMKTITTGIILIDSKTNLVKKRSNSADIDGSMDAMGQTIPFTSKTTIESEYK